MNNYFFKNSSFYFVSSFINKALAILLVPLYTKYLSPSDYGLIDFISISINLFVIVFSLQLNQAIARYYQDLKDKGESGQLIFISLSVSFIVSLIALVVIFYSKSWIDNLLSEPLPEKLFTIVCMQIFFQLGFYIIQNVFRYSLNVKTEIFLNVLLTVLSLSSVIIFVVFYKKGVLGVFYAQLISYFICFSLAFLLSYKFIQLKFNYSLLKRLLGFSIPLIFSGLSVFVFTYIDRLMIGKFLGLQSMGIYGIALRVVTFSTFIFSSFSSALVPLTYKAYKNREFDHQVNKIFDIVSIISGLVILFISLFSNEIILIFTTEDYLPASFIIPFLLIATISNSFSMFFLGLEIKEKTKKISIIFFVGGLLNLILNFYLIPPFGIVGAAISTLISSLFILLVRAYFSNKFHNISYSFKNLVIVIISALVLSFIGVKDWLCLGPILIVIQKTLILFLFGFMLYSLEPYRSIIMETANKIKTNNSRFFPVKREK